MWWIVAFLIAAGLYFGLGVREPDSLFAATLTFAGLLMLAYEHLAGRKQ